MRQVFNIGAFCLESDQGAWKYFHPKDKNELETITGGVFLFLFDTLDLFREKGMNRFKDLEAGQLSCLWAEVSRPGAKAGEATDAHFIVPLRGLTSDQVRDVLTDLCDAARKASGFEDWQARFDARQKQRSAPTEEKPPTPPAPETPAHGSNYDPMRYSPLNPERKPWMKPPWMEPAGVPGQATKPQAGPAAANPQPPGPPLGNANPAPANPGAGIPDTGAHPQHDHLLVRLGQDPRDRRNGDWHFLFAAGKALRAEDLPDSRAEAGESDRAAHLRHLGAGAHRIYRRGDNKAVHSRTGAGIRRPDGLVEHDSAELRRQGRVCCSRLRGRPGTGVG